MALISLDLNQARQTAGTFSSSGNTLDDVCGQLRQQWSSLSSTWEGDSKYDVASELHSVLNWGQHCAEHTCERGVKMTQIADRFQEADESTKFVVQSVAWSPITPQASEDDQENWLGWGIDRTKDTLGLFYGAINKADLKYEDYRDVGRWLNQLVGNAHGGWVGRMDDLGHFIEQNPKFFDYGIPLALGFFANLASGDTFLKATVTDVVDFALQKGIKTGVEKGLEYLIPGAGQVMLVYDGALLVGRLAAGGADLLGAHDFANGLTNVLDVVDIGTYTGKIADAVYDFGDYYLSHPDKLVPDLTDTAQKVSDASAGFIQDASSFIGSTVEGAESWFGSVFGL